jgi:hypothetical protein
MYQTHDTDWSTSQKGNEWRRIDGKVLVVGRKKDGRYWAMVDGEFLEGSFVTELLAKSAAVEKANGKDDDSFWEGL